MSKGVEIKELLKLRDILTNVGTNIVPEKVDIELSRIVVFENNRSGCSISKSRLYM